MSRALRRTQRAAATLQKAGGGGAVSTAGRQSRASLGLRDALIGGALGFITGGPAGAVAGAAAGLVQPEGPSQPPVSGPSGPVLPPPGGPTIGQPFVQQTCPPGSVRIAGRCVNPAAAMPGGAPMVTQPTGPAVALPFASAGPAGQAVVGAFGMPGIAPVSETRTRLRCPAGYRLGRDNICYPKAVLSRNSTYRKWRPGPRPAVSGSDVKAIRRAARTKDRVLELAKSVGLHASKSKPAGRKRASSGDAAVKALLARGVPQITAVDLD